VTIPSPDNALDGFGKSVINGRKARRQKIDMAGPMVAISAVFA
jgi:hypothetical protein